MKFLFFDIECSNCDFGIGKMCEFGYVLTDENFNILLADDLPMSPGQGKKNSFNLKGREGEKDLELAYDEDFYLSQKEFPHFYNHIGKLVEDKDTICFAYSMNNDIAHLHHSCTRYKRTPFNYTCYDIQKLAGKYLLKNTQVSLKEACRLIVGPNSTIKLVEHLSRDDAKMEMMVFEAVCCLEKKSAVELLKEMDYAKTNSIEHMNLALKRSREKQMQRNNNALYKKRVASDEILDDLTNIGKRFILSGKIKSNHDILKTALNLIRDNGCFVSNTVDKSDFFVALDDDNKIHIQEHLINPYNGEFITYEDLQSKFKMNKLE